jgi:hypothetical protein
MMSYGGGYAAPSPQSFVRHPKDFARHVKPPMHQHTQEWGHDPLVQRGSRNSPLPSVPLHPQPLFGCNSTMIAQVPL